MKDNFNNTDFTILRLVCGCEYVVLSNIVEKGDETVHYIRSSIKQEVLRRPTGFLFK